MILGIDEHTACIIDIEAQRMNIQGIGNVTVRKMGREIKLGKGDKISIDALIEEFDQEEWSNKKTDEDRQIIDVDISKNDLLGRLNLIASSLRDGLAQHDHTAVTSALLELDSTIWKAQKELENEENISEAREILRDSIVLLASELTPSPRNLQTHMAPLVEGLLQLRKQFRKEKKWSDADRIRDVLQQANILVEDKKDGFRWRIIEEDL
jgi:cysteinyl-tRNA synthetase